MDQRSVLPILLIVQCHLCIGYIGLRRGDRQFGIRDRFRGSQLGQIFLGGDQVCFQGSLGGILHQAGQDILGFDLIADFCIHLVHLPAGQPVDDRRKVRSDRARAFHGGGKCAALDRGRLVRGCAAAAAGAVSGAGSAGSAGALGAQVGEDQHQSDDYHQHCSDNDPGFLVFAHFSSPVSNNFIKYLTENHGRDPF